MGFPVLYGHFHWMTRGPCQRHALPEAKQILQHQRSLIWISAFQSVDECKKLAMLKTPCVQNLSLITGFLELSSSCIWPNNRWLLAGNSSIYLGIKCTCPHIYPNFVLRHDMHMCIASNIPQTPRKKTRLNFLALKKLKIWLQIIFACITHRLRNNLPITTGTAVHYLPILAILWCRTWTVQTNLQKACD